MIEAKLKKFGLYKGAPDLSRGTRDMSPDRALREAVEGLWKKRSLDVFSGGALDVPPDMTLESMFLNQLISRTLDVSGDAPNA
jgi:hypothetical protein